jgi:diguanylate cyclase (GGDEF)-like protein/PAS domain S-box-containing protein
LAFHLSTTNSAATMPILTTTAAPPLTDLAPPPAPHQGSAAATERATLEAVLEHGSDAVIGLDAAGRVLSWNGRAEQLLGWARDSALGRPLGALCMTAAARAHYEQTLQLVLECGDTALLPQRAAWTLQQRGGSDVAVEASVVALPAAPAASGPAPARFLAILHDISERQMLLAALEMMALRDPLTRLPNRRALMQMLPEAMQRALRLGRPLALLLVRAGGLRHVNQQHGHEQGDTLLTQFATRIGATLRRTDTVARLAGDEFVAVLEMLNTADNARDSADKLMAALSLPFVVDGTVVQLSAQIGVALHWPDGDADATALLNRAELALPAAPPAPTGQPAQAA